MTESLLIVGVHNQVGVSLLERLRGGAADVIACSRASAPTAPGPGVRWIAGGVDAADLDGVTVDGLVYLAPLPLLPGLMGRVTVKRTLVVFSSMSAESKRRSPSSAEREVAEALRTGEAAAREWGDALQAPAQIFRPTLVYGRGMDRNLSRIAALIRRVNRMVLPQGELGLRQPVHADDLAAAALQAIADPPREHTTFELGGGERLRYDVMVERIFQSLALPPRVHRWPKSLLTGAVGVASLLPSLRGIDSAMVERMGRDLVANNERAAECLSYAPRPFRPAAETWTRRPLS